MITFIIKGKDQELVKYFWAPFQVKYPNYEYLFVDEKQFEQIIAKAKNNTLFITDVDAVPTYETMVLLERIEGKNEVLLPIWFEGYKKPNKKLNSFSIPKEIFISSGYNLEECIKQTTLTVHQKGTMYYVR